MNHPHEERFGVPVSGVRDAAPSGPQDEFSRRMGQMVGGKFAPIGGGSPEADKDKPKAKSTKKGKKDDSPPDPSDMSDEELSTEEQDLVEQLQAEYDGDRDLDKMRDMRDRITALRTEQDDRATEAEKRDAEAEEIMADVVVQEEGDGEGEGEGDGEGDQPAGEGEGEGEGEGDGEDADANAEDKTPIAAAGDEKSKPKPRPRLRVNEPMPTAPKGANKPADSKPGDAVVVASANFPGVPAGTELNAGDLGDLIAKQGHNMLSRKQKNVGIPIARVTAEFPEERKLGSDPFENRKKLQAVVSEKAVAAAGGTCAPLAPSYDFQNIATTARPLAAALPNFNAPRGGMKWIPVVSITDPKYAAGIAIITEAEDAAGYVSGGGPTPDKPCVVVDCPDEDEVKVQAQVQCVEIGNFNRRFFPELFADFWAKATAVFARTAENEIWNAMVAASAPINASQQLGVFRDIVNLAARAQVAFHMRHRTEPGIPMVLYAPSWLATMAGIDLLRQAPGDNTYAVGEAELRAALQRYNTRLVLSPDAGDQFIAFGGESDSDLDYWPDEVTFVLAHEGAFVRLDEGTLDFGMEIRDSTLNKQNQVQAMYETFEAVAMTGYEPLAVTAEICADGSFSDATGTVNCTGLPS